MSKCDIHSTFPSKNRRHNTTRTTRLIARCPAARFSGQLLKDRPAEVFLRSRKLLE
ncbi:MAG TPA: hypothetical protein VFV38_48260 [Ktedonobacteraceae bacterium]|nr:hypothetical protein [Ktedonobacteraceae bacterium]